MAYKPKPDAAARRDALAALLRDGLAALHRGAAPSPEQSAAIRNAYRTACRAVRAGIRSANTARQEAVKCQIEDARAAFAQGPAPMAFAPPPMPPVASLPADLDPFTGRPIAKVAPPQNFVL